MLSSSGRRVGSKALASFTVNSRVKAVEFAMASR
jgi:hypothetical protein